MDKTPNYSLSQWARSDQVRMEDFNADNAKIDVALKAEADARAAADAAEAQARAALAAQVAKRGNCQIWTTSYRGTGTYGSDKPTSLTFPKPPLFALITAGGALMLLMPGCSSSIFHSSNSGHGENNVSWSGNTVTWYASIYPSQYVQMNSSGVQYHVIAFYLADQD